MLSCRKPKRWLDTCLLLAAHFLLATAALAAPPLEWLDLRRAGAPAIVAAARTRSAAIPWQRVYKANVPAGHPMAGLKIAVARRFSGHAQIQVRVVAGPAQLVGTGVVIDGSKGWVHAAGGKTVPLPHDTLFRIQPVLDVPWILFSALEWESQYTPTVEGEFDQVAVLRLAPRYELGLTALAAKVSISKETGFLIASSLQTGKGVKMGEVNWQEFDTEGRPAAFSLRGPGEEAKPVLFVADGPATAPAKNAFTATALR